MLKDKFKNYMVKHEDGFTIIEVIIVLVIGAVIMLAVFLVVPQLQQSQRNSRQQDNARRVLTAVQQFASANQNAFPSAQNVLDTTGPLTNPRNNSALTATNINTTATAAPAFSSTTVGNIWVFNNATCASSTTLNTGPNVAGYAVMVGLEPATGYCVSI